MKLIKVSRLPKDSTCRFVVDNDGKLLGGIGTAKDMLEANWVSIRGTPKNAPDLTKWLAVDAPIDRIEVFNTRAEALAVFAGDEDEELLERRKRRRCDRGRAGGTVCDRPDQGVYVMRYKHGGEN